MKVNRDSVLGIVLLGIGAYIVFGKNVVVGKLISLNDIYLARADVYLRGLGILLCLLSGILIVRSLLTHDNAEAQKAIQIPGVVLISIVSLVLFAVFLPAVGFMVSGTVFCSAITAAYWFKEKGIVFADRQKVARVLLASLVYGLLVTFVLKTVFTKFLGVILS